jgi:methylthioribose-1-phosphate isomerase
MIKAVDWQEGVLWIIDQTLLPHRVERRALTDYRGVAEAIRSMRVRGAPAIGVAAAFGVVLGAREILEKGEDFPQKFEEVLSTLAKTRPTAVNLFWALDRMRRVYEQSEHRTPKEMLRALEATAVRMLEEDIQANRAMGQYGQQLLQDGWTVLTHCNTGSLATVSYGTALGVIRAAREAGKEIKVIADETRPRLQGARLTAWECLEEGIPCTVIADGAAASLMRQGRIQAAIVGADRIARNGDVANKIGTYMVALACQAHQIPFYVAAPLSTVDLSLASGEEIPIEERPPEEITHIEGVRIAPEGVKVYNPAFDVTPAELVTAIITERGIAYPPYEKSLPSLFEQANKRFDRVPW